MVTGPSPMRLTIATKIGLLLVLPTIGALLALGAFYHFLRQTAPYADYLVTAQDQRQHARLLHAFADRTGIEAADRDYLGSAVQVFDQAWPQRLPPPPPEALPSIREVKRLWAQVRPKLVFLAGQPAGDAAADQTHRVLHPEVPHLQRACEQVVGVLEAKLESLRQRMLRSLAWICGVDLTLLLAGLWITTLYIVGPLRLLEQAARRMRKGDFTSRVPVVAGDEIGALSQTFNDMSANVARLVAAVESGRRRSEAILSSVPLGLLVVGPDLRVLSWNAHIPPSLSPDPYDLAGRTLPEVLPASGVQSHALAVLATGTPVSNLFWEPPGGDSSSLLKITITRMQESEPGQDRHLLVVLADLSELERPAEIAARLAQVVAHHGEAADRACVQGRHQGEWLPHQAEPAHHHHGTVEERPGDRLAGLEELVHGAHLSPSPPPAPMGAGASVTIRARGDPPSLPNAIICSHRNAAPADVPATWAPSEFRRRSALAIEVPPIRVLRRSWFPPVRKTPSESSRISSSSRRSASSRAWMGRDRAWAAPSSRNSVSYRWPVSFSSEAVGMMAMRPPGPHSEANRRRIVTSPIFSSAPPTGMMNPWPAGTCALPPRVWPAAPAAGRQVVRAA